MWKLESMILEVLGELRCRNGIALTQRTKVIRMGLGSFSDMKRLRADQRHPCRWSVVLA